MENVKKAIYKIKEKALINSNNLFKSIKKSYHQIQMNRMRKENDELKSKIERKIVINMHINCLPMYLSLKHICN